MPEFDAAAGTVGDWARRSGLPRLDAHLLLEHVLGLRRADLIAHPERPLIHAERERLDALASRARDAEPLAYLLGRREFFGLEFAVRPGVLVPRPDTEILVEAALEALPPPGNDYRPAALDMGTGSGAVAVSLAHARPDLAMWATDLSEDALRIATENAARLLPPGRPAGPLRALPSDWFSALREAGAPRFDIIVSNPPYIAADDPHLPALRHEPALALTGGTPTVDGLGDIRRIVADAPAWLQPGGWLLLEHGHDQAAAVQKLLAAHGFAGVHSRADLAGIDRVTGGHWPGTPAAAKDGCAS